MVLLVETPAAGCHLGQQLRGDSGGDGRHDNRRLKCHLKELGNSTSLFSDF